MTAEDTSPSLGDSAQLQRLHPATFFIVLADIARQFLLPALIVWVVGSNRTFELLLMILAVPAFLWAVLRYFSVKIGWTEHHLVVATGIVDRQEQRIPLQRIQSIETRRTLVHRLFNVDDVIVHTGGGSGAEATLSAVASEDVARLRSRLGHHEVVDQQASPRANWRQLTGYGMAYNRGIVVLAVLLGLLWQADLVEWGHPWILADWWWQQAQVSLWLGVAWGLGICLLAWSSLRLSSIIWAWIMLHGFTLRQHDGQVHLSYGLLFHRKIALPEQRFHILELTQTWFHRLSKALTVEAWTAGTWAGGDEESVDSEWDEYFKTQILLPFADEPTATDLVRQLIGEPDWRTVDWRAVELRPLVKIFLRLCLMLSPPTGAISVLLFPWGLLAVPFVMAISLWHAVVEVACTGYALTSHGVWLRRGFWRRRWRVIQYANIQSVEIFESPLDRLKGTAEVRIDAGSAPAGMPAIRIPYLLRGDADRVASQLGRLAAREMT